jgi:integrase/recombinase XerD
MNREEEYNNYLLLSKYSPNTYYIYNCYAKELFNHKHTGIINQEDINYLLAKHNHRVYRAFLKSFLELFNDTHLKIPKVKGRARQKRLKYLTRTEIYKLIAKLPERESTLIELMFTTGLRITEAVNLKVKDIDQTESTIKGIGKGNKDFEQPITKGLRKRLYMLANQTQRTYDQTVFYYGEVKSPRKKALYEIQKNAKLIVFKHVTPHMIRHSCGTFLREQGWDLREVQEFLRHSQLETTKIYTHVDAKKLRDKWRTTF